MSDRVALFDMDGTLFDLNSRMLEELDKMRSPGEPKITDPFEDQPWLENRRRAIKRVPGFWKTLPKYKPGWDILEIAKRIGYDLHILTKGPSSIPAAWMEKVECIRMHMKCDVTIHVTEDKGVLYGRVLVDDWPPYMKSWLKHRPRGLGIMPAHPENDGFEHPNVIRYTGENIAQVVDALAAAYKREDKQHWKKDE